jgi:hypothetical protein
MPNSRVLLAVCGCAVLSVLAGCGADETQPAEDHTPDTYTITVDGNAASAPYTFTEGQTALVQIQFVNKEGESLDDVESEHFAGLHFQPTTLATAVRRADHHFQFDVTGGTTGTGTLTVGFGHDDAADEVSFPAAAVTVDQSGGSGGL